MSTSEVTALTIANTLHGPAADRDVALTDERSHDHLADPAAARDYLSAQGLDVPSALPSNAELERLREFRLAARALTDKRPTAARRRLEQLLTRFTYRLDVDGSLTPTSSGWDGVVASALPAVLHLLEENQRLQTCANPDCRWLFVDRSKNHSRIWCDMGTCGSRAKMARYRDRKRSGR